MKRYLGCIKNNTVLRHGERGVGKYLVPPELALQEKIHQKYGYTNIIGVSPAMIAAFEIMRKIQKQNVSVTLLGESGTGKELFARSLHYGSDRAGKPFVPVNCVSIPENLVESVMFGHRKGAFTGADEDRKGLFEAAHSGTIFLDEIGDISLDAQAKLLRVLQERQITRVGDTVEIPIDVRLITATHQNLVELLEQGLFRMDLYYRINVIPIELPPLRERQRDIPLLAYHILAELADEGIGEQIIGFTQRALNRLSAYPWPGNVREMKNVLQRAVLLADRDILDASDLSLPLATSAGKAQLDTFHATKREVLRDFEQRYLASLLKITDGNISAAAKYAGLDRSHFYQMMKRNRIDVETHRQQTAE